MSRHRRVTCPTLLGFLFVLTASRFAWGEAVLVVRPDSSDTMLMETFSRLCGELRMYGLQVQLSEREDGVVSHEPGSELVGGISLFRAPGQANARIWIAEATTGNKSLGITVSVDDAEAPSLLAIRAADLMWTGLKDLERADRRRERRTPEVALAAAGPSTTAADFELERWTLQGDMGAFWETGDLGAGLAAHIGLARRISARLALAIETVVPLTAQTYTASSASAHLRGTLGLTTIRWRPWAWQRLSLDLFQGLGAAHLSVRGEAQAPWSGQSASSWTAASSTGGCVGLALSEHLGLIVSAAVVFLLPGPAIEVLGVEYTMRQPLLITTAGLRYGF